MKMRKIVTTILLVFCFVFVGTLSSTYTTYAKKISSIDQAKKKALKKVKNAVVTEAEKDYENGKAIYEVTLLKNTKKYDLTYRASNGKLISYGWEKNGAKTGTGSNIMTKSECKQLAKNKVKKGTIIRVTAKYDDGIYVYKVKMKKGNKKYTLEYHAGNGKLLEYEWDLVSKTSNKNSYIGTNKAKKIALSQVPGATVKKVELDKDDGIAVYEVELISGQYEYEIKIDAKTGKILEIDKDYKN